MRRSPYLKAFSYEYKELVMVALGAIAGAAGTALSLASSAKGLFGSSSSNDMSAGEMVQAQKELMDYQQQKNLQNSWVDYQYNKDFQNRQFNMNKWFVQNEYQNAVSDLRKAGLNPLLGVPSGNSGQVGGAGVSTPGTGLLDPSSAISSQAQMKQADTAMKLGVLQTVADMAEKYSASAKNIQDARAKATSVDNIKADTALKTLQQQRSVIENSNLDKQMKANILKTINDADAVIRSVRVQESLVPSQIYSNYTSAKANMINATSGNPTKVISDIVSGFTGANANDNGKKLRQMLDGLVNDLNNKGNKNKKVNFNDMKKYYEILKGVQ